MSPRIHPPSPAVPSRTTRPWHARVTLPLVALLTLVGPAPAPAAETAAAAKPPPRLKRSESFLGIHFDFHAGPDGTEVGRNTTPAMVAAILDKVQPDYLQVDGKGHPGYSSYPTRVGNPVPGFVGDPLRVWRDVTAARGVALYLHYSGVWDSRAIELHPDWAARNPDGTPNRNATSVFGPYVDRLLIPQLRELAGDYGIDGVWVDGECWATVPDHGDDAVKAFRAATGITSIPTRISDPNGYAWMEFQREGFRRYLRHYIAEVNRTHPDFEIASNWAFSDHMPEPVSAPVAFLSGDFSPQDSVNSARFSARCLANQGRPWDLMAWSFPNVKSGPRQQKSAVQLQREAALVLAQGGGFQAYFTQQRDGSVDLAKMEAMAEVARFCRERQALAHRATVVPQIALLYSRASHQRQSPQLFTPNSPTVRALRAILQALTENQHCVQIVSEHHLQDHCSDWPLIILPGCEFLEPAFREALTTHIRNGGRVLAIGPRCARLLQSPTDASPATPSPTGTVRLELHGSSTHLSSTWEAPSHPKGTSLSLGLLHPADSSQPPIPAATLESIGRGQLGSVWFNLAGATSIPLARELLNDILRSLFPEPQLRVTGSRDLDLSLTRNHGKTVVHLVNTSGPHASEPFIDVIQPVGPLEVSLHQSAPPSAIHLEPGHRPVVFTHAGGITRFRIPEVAIHAMAVLD